jgi:hypothetical protein
MLQKRIMRKWSWKRVLKAVERNLPTWKINQEEPEFIDSSIKIKLLCPKGHENEKEARKVELGKKSLGCPQCIRENQAQNLIPVLLRPLKITGGIWFLHLRKYLMVKQFPHILRSK